MPGLIDQLRNEVAAINAAASHLVRARPGERPTISLVNASTVLSDAEVASHVAALQTQLDRDFEPIWNAGGIVTFTPRGKAPPASAWWLIYADTSDQAGAAGYHDVTSTGFPQGKIFAMTDRQFGLESSVTASHELLEMIGDPWIKLISGVYSSPNGQGRIYAQEMCDPVEADVLGYSIGGIQVSDFLLPRYFEPGSPGPYSFEDHLPSPLTLAPGGYQSYMDVASSAGWQQLTSQEMPSRLDGSGPVARENPRTIARAGSRRERRSRMAIDNVRRRGGFAGWVRSTVVAADE